MRFLKVMCVLVLVFAVSAIAYAETQSIKISGDITERAFLRSNYDLVSGGNEANVGTRSSNWSSFLLSQVEIQIDADLTDNVSAVIRLLNQKVWGDNAYTSGAELQALTQNDIVVANRTKAAGTDSFSVDLELAYIELKEFLYSPLTLRIGRQDLWFGRGFVVGANLQDPGNHIYPAEYTKMRGFDAIRATLDFDPWTIDAVYAKIAENAMRSDDDVDLIGLNVGYVFDSYNAEAEAYYWLEQSRNPGAAAGISINSSNGNIDNSTNTVGMRGSFDPIEDWTVALETAYQFGAYLGVADGREWDRSAWAVDVEVECRAFQDDFAWKPVGSIEYIYYSGQENMGNMDTTSGDTYHGWNPVFRGKFDTAIREWQNVFYATTMNSSPASTNQHQILLKGSIEPTDDIMIKATYANFWLAQTWSNEYNHSTSSGLGNDTPHNENLHVGQELDLQITWDYTEDVSFGLLAAWFMPGNHFTSFSNDAIASDVVGTVKLSF